MNSLTYIREMIDADSDFSLSQRRFLDFYLAGDRREGYGYDGMAFRHSVVGPRSTIHYDNPTFVQYAVICGKANALSALLKRARNGRLISLEVAFLPRSSNTKFDLLSLAILEHH
jgi:hypothetical protein